MPPPPPPPPPPMWKRFFHIGAKDLNIIKESSEKAVSDVKAQFPEIDSHIPYLVKPAFQIQQNIMSIIGQAPNSPEVFQFSPGYAKFRGVLLSGHGEGDVSVGGGNEVLGGIYTNGIVSFSEGAVMVEDSYYLSGVIDHFLPVLPGVPSPLNILVHKPGSVIPSNPANLRNLPKRAHIINTYEISPIEAGSAGLPQ